MSKKSRPERKTTVISLISGKGGVGKTALTASMGKLLALIGFKVLMVDSDLITHGLTFLLGFDPERPGFLEEYNNFKDFEALCDENKLKEAGRAMEKFREKFGKDEVCMLSENLYFLQSTSMPSKKYSQQVLSEADKIDEVFKVLLDDYIKSKRYDFILIDTQAGSVSATRTAVSISQKVVTIMEPDPVATYATENVVGELSDVLPRDSFYLINKLSVEEASTYEAIETFVKILRHLPPVPFDFEVRRAFMIRQIPINEKKPSAFLFGVIRMLRDLLPNISDNLEKFEKRVEEITILPLKKSIQIIKRDLDNSIIAQVEVKKRIEQLRIRKERPLFFIRQSLGMISASVLISYMAYFLFTSYFEVKLPGLQEILQVAMVMIVGVTVVYVTYIYRGVYGKKERAELEELEKNLALLEESQKRMRHDYEAYNNLLITRSKDLTLKMNKTERQENQGFF